MLPHSTNFGLFHSLLKRLWPSRESCPYHRSSVSRDGRMRNSLQVTCVKVYIYISLLWRCYCKCGIFGRQFFFLSHLFFFFFPKSICYYNLFWHYFRSGIGSAHNKCKRKNAQYLLHCSSDPSPQSLKASQRLDTWIHSFWFAQSNWLARQVTRWSKELHESWPIVDTKYVSLHYHFDCEGYVTSRARAVSIENLVIWKDGSQLTFKVFVLFCFMYLFFCDWHCAVTFH